MDLATCLKKMELVGVLAYPSGTPNSFISLLPSSESNVS